MPPISPIETGLDAGPRYVDELLSTTVNGTITSCVASCDAGQPENSCAPNPAIGPPSGHDGGFFLGQSDVLVAAFLCNQYVTAHADAGDLTIAAVLEPTGYAIVEVSKDGSDFSTLGILDGGPSQTFSLSTIGTDQTRYLRITGQGKGVTLESIEAL